MTAVVPTVWMATTPTMQITRNQEIQAVVGVVFLLATKAI
jgi:hypothetical protein